MKDMYFLILDILRQMWRFRWWSVLVLWVIGLLGAIGIMALPNVYEARAQFYVDADSRLRDVVSKIGMTPGVSSRLLLVEQAMLGKPSLESVAEHTGLTNPSMEPGEYEGVDSIVDPTGACCRRSQLFRWFDVRPVGFPFGSVCNPFCQYIYLLR